MDAYDDYNEGTLSSPDILTSYCCPMRDEEGHYVGSITASLTLKWLSEMVTRLKHGMEHRHCLSGERRLCTLQQGARHRMDHHRHRSTIY